MLNVRTYMEDKQKRIAASLNPPFYLFSNIITGPVLGGRSDFGEPMGSIDRTRGMGFQAVFALI